MTQPFRFPSQILGATFLAAVLSVERARAQAPTVDSSYPPLPGSSSSLLGSAPGSGGGSFINQPGTAGILGGRPGVTTPKGIPATIGSPATQAGPTINQQSISAPESQAVTRSSAPPYGTLEIPAGAEDDGPENGLTLDQAITVTLERSRDLKAKFHEIPMARADTLQASLRYNPIFYWDAQLFPYGQYNKLYLGGPPQYDINVTYPFDVSHKRQARTMVAARAEKVLEAQYQDAVRQRIDDVYSAYINALAARQTLRYAEQSTKGLADLESRTQALFKGGSATEAEWMRAKIQLRTARLGLSDSKAAMRKALLDLGALMNLTNAESRAIELRGTIMDAAPHPPPLPKLLEIALEDRPDLLSFRLGLTRARADVQLAKANAFNDVYLLYQPFTFQDNQPFGLKSTYGWAVGMTVTLPVFNRNQGGVQRANLNVTQTQIELSDLEHQVLVDVEKALEEYQVTRLEVEELRDQLIAEAREVRDDARRLYLSGETSIVAYINAELEFNQVAKQYLDTAVRHRQSMLSLNTAVGRRILP